MRIENTFKNGIVGLVSQFFIIISGFVLRAIFIKTLGQEYLGLNGLFADLLSIISVTELGIGSAITFSLYKPLFEGEIDIVSGLMNLYKKSYRIIGAIIIIISLCLLPFIQVFIKDYTMDLNYIRLIFFLFVINAVITYFLGYRRIILYAHQKNYRIILIDFIGKLILISLQIWILISTRNYILYLSLLISYTVITNLIIYFIVGKEYPFLKNNKSILPVEIKTRVFKSIKYLALSTLIGVGVLGTDRIIISSFIGISVLAVYSNYSMIIAQIGTLFTTLLNGISAPLGDLIAEGNKERIRFVFGTYSFAYFLVASFTNVSLFVLLTPFIRDIWLSPNYVMSPVIVTIIVFNSYLFFIRQPIWQLQNTAGLFKDYLPFSLLELVLNLTVSIIAVNLVGIIGVFIGTSVAYSVSWIGQSYKLHKVFFNEPVSGYYQKQLKYFLLFLLEVFTVYWISNSIIIDNPFVSFILKSTLVVTIPNLINFMIFRKTNEFQYLKNITLGKLTKFKK